ncbi:MAG: hypothetical protein ONB44_17820 [candidate division KSB1 bacterium]|nr:hypothetical protein [candidate division KSB1 bacterium]MDZ7303985.1 hypothetical protein [candidate division KSB1 bacterium]MDZ7313938.1 hypothetical protein [candidate division KSB1 bacterium]
MTLSPLVSEALQNHGYRFDRLFTFGIRISILFATLIFSQAACWAQHSAEDLIAASFDRQYGQLEIGGKYVGAEFHHSFPLPSRISFYVPVANSIDLSTDYWRRDESKPFTVVIAVNGKIDTVGREPFPYRWTPFSAVFTQTKPAYKVEFAYHFCDDLPAMVVQMKFRNISKNDAAFKVFTKLETSLRTCQSYTLKNQARTEYINSGSVIVANFDEMDTDSAQVFVANVGERPVVWSCTNRLGASSLQNQKHGPVASFGYDKTLAPNGELIITQLVGSCRQTESREVLQRSLREWKQSVQKNEQRVLHYVRDQSKFEIHDLALRQTARWSKAILATNLHHINGHIVPMPCPAEYNFYFTHDVLLTDLGAVLFDTERVKHDLLFLRSLTQADSILPHAYYWRDDGFKTEFCASDNWNHLWFIILASSYLKHSGDRETVAAIYPMLAKSLDMMLANKSADDLMYASRPDWWDMGNVYGARAYITTLMIRALRDFSFITLQLGKQQEPLREYVDLARRMQASLNKNLWDEDAGFLLNMLDATAIDRHYYAGSLLPAAFDLLDEARKTRLLETAKRELLDEKLGIRNAMPANFHELIEVYKFKGMEAGAPYVYANGGIWPHGTAWYALGWLAAEQPDAAYEVLKKYLTLEGIMNSPNGQPAFFEYRHADPLSPKYGEIDKPTFLWAAGWYLHVLYHLAGVRENEWNISFDPNLPTGFEDITYDLTLNGTLSEVIWKGNGRYFKRIVTDGRDMNSAVIFASPKKILLERGEPESPYLAGASCLVDQVHYDAQSNSLQVRVRGIQEQDIALKVVAASSPQKVFVDGIERSDFMSTSRDDKVAITIFHSTLKQPKSTLIFRF